MYILLNHTYTDTYIRSTKKILYCRYLQNIKFKNVVTIIALINNCALQITNFMFSINHITVFYFERWRPSTEKIVRQEVLPVRLPFFRLNDRRRGNDDFGVRVRARVRAFCARGISFWLWAFAGFFGRRQIFVHFFPAPPGAHVVRLANVRLAVVFVLYGRFSHFLEKFWHCPVMVCLF